MTIVARSRKAGSAWSREDITSLQACILRGNTIAEIAWLLGRLEYEVERKLDEIDGIVGKPNNPAVHVVSSS